MNVSQARVNANALVGLLIGASGIIVALVVAFTR